MDPMKIVEAEAETILRRAKELGLSLADVHDEEGMYIVRTDEEAIALMTCCDLTVARFVHTATGEYAGRAWLVWGNEPGVAIADHSDHTLMDRLSTLVNEDMEARFPD